jgi:hypothetical protein
MATIIAGTPGAPVNSTPANTPPAAGLRSINTNELGATEIHGRYYEGAYRGGRFGAALQVVSATAMQTGLTTSATGGMVLANPPGSSVMCVLEKVGIAMVLAQTSASALGISVGWSPTVVPAFGTPVTVTPRSRKVGAGYAAQCTVQTGATCTLPVAPTLDTIFAFVDTITITSTTTFLGGLYDLDGGIILQPGAFASFYATNGLLVSSYFLSMQWEETPL